MFYCFNRIILALIFLFVSLQSISAQTLSADAGAAFLKILTNVSCYVIPLGKQNLVALGNYPASIDINGRWSAGEPVPIDPNQPNPVAKSVAALLRMGLVKLAYLGEHMDPPYSGRILALMNVQFTGKLDGTNIRTIAGKPCIQMSDFSKSRVEISRTEIVKGGKTAWVGAIAYLQVQNITMLPLYKSLLTTQGFMPPSVEKDRPFRVLYRQEPFKGSWSVVAYDYYLAANNKFFGTKVPEALEGD